MATCLRLGTSNTVRRQFYRYLLPNGYVERVGRGVYEITVKGEKFLEILAWHVRIKKRGLWLS
ncbi:MAG: hypothetical protein AOA66_1204 [Candidatus Bathyarchaeota archaeon BA2]|nr:MAG: hypothetical protein AOA66_1204 [Candidatus Bathyarchaeota archaeon BA2]